MKFSSKKILFCFLIVFFILTPLININAQTDALKKAKDGLIKSASIEGAGLTSDTVENVSDGREEIRSITAQIVGYILAMLGIILLVQIIFSGYSWMMSGGNEEKIKSAKDKILNSIIGLAIILIAYILVNTIFGLLIKVTQTIPK